MEQVICEGNMQHTEGMFLSLAKVMFPFFITHFNKEVKQIYLICTIYSGKGHKVIWSLLHCLQFQQMFDKKNHVLMSIHVS